MLAIKSSDVLAIPLVHKDLTKKLNGLKNLRLFTLIFGCGMGLSFAASYRYLSPSRVQTGILFGFASATLIAGIIFFYARVGIMKKAKLHKFLENIKKLQFNDAVEDSKQLINPNYWNFNPDNINSLENSGVHAFVDAPCFTVAEAIHQSFWLMALNEQIQKASYQVMNDSRNQQLIADCENNYRLFKALSLAAGKKIFNDQLVKTFNITEVTIPKNLFQGKQ